MANSQFSEKNQTRLGLWNRIGLGCTAAALVSVPLSMGVTIFDRSVIRKVNGSAPNLFAAVTEGFKTAGRAPISTFLKTDNRVVFGVYACTYMSKNSMEATSNYYSWNPFWPVLMGTTVVNTTLGILKDKYLAKAFGSGEVNFPKSSLAFFTARDLVIVGASFNGPTYVAPVIQEKTGMTQDNSEMLAQLVCPGAAQIFATPLHILGLDMYNRPNLTFNERISGLLRRTLDPLAVRMCRQIYVFGVGSIAVKKVSRALGFYDPAEVKYVANLSSAATPATK
jgi:hypothetical protein